MTHKFIQLLITLFSFVPLKAACDVVAPASGVARLRIWNDGPQTRDQIRARMQEIQANVKTMHDKAKNEQRDLTDEELTQCSTLSDEFAGLRDRYEQTQNVSDVLDFDFSAASQGRRHPGNDPSPAHPQNRGGGSGTGQDPGTQLPANAGGGQRPRHIEVSDNLPQGQWGFRNFGDFGRAVVNAAMHNGMDPRLERVADMAIDEFGIRGAASDGAVERIGEEGGFLIPPDFRQGITQKVTGEESLLGRTDQIPVTGNTFTMNADETTPWQTSGGILAFWEGEQQQYTGSRPKFTPSTVRANKLTSLVIVSDELLEDASALSAYLSRKAPEKMDYKVTDAIYNGNGIGRPLGLRNAAATVSQAKESAQAADTIVYENVINMYSKLYAPCLPRSVWIANQDIMPQLLSMVIEGSSGGVFPVYQPPRNAADPPFGTLMGRPIVFTEAAQTLGDKGDLMLVDLTQYLSLIKSGGVRADTSIHLYFDYGETAFRFTMRIGGQPWWSEAITKAAGGTLGCAVTLDERA